MDAHLCHTVCLGIDRFPLLLVLGVRTITLLNSRYAESLDQQLGEKLGISARGKYHQY